MQCQQSQNSGGFEENKIEMVKRDEKEEMFKLNEEISEVLRIRSKGQVGQIYESKGKSLNK